MAPIRSLVAATLLFLSAANAHFELNQPPSLEGDKMNEDLEATGPCGGGVADLSKNTATDFHVDGDAVGVLLGHPQAKFLIRATLDTKAAGNWTQLYPIFLQSGRGNFCEPAVTAPKEWVGKKGIIGIACAAPDGMLFQCAAVNFVSGSNTSPQSCTNGSSVSASFDTDPSLTALVGDASTPGSSTAPSPSESTSGNAAASLLAGGSGMPVGSMAVTAAMLLLGAALF
ncbi:hypothetical protein C8A00DRAFT_16569 [Chaetomidium leptoderma]|uniref:Copper acquisition factor BIM1-like domain-containing protein n=1 Tax=Chaetomidium leptoderma TaxID=669021 RepID=A0AAN6VID0_9PEZI|nr:hypothetical protein C8A00DRAFT_16569 [Chaetomidium leptoderma]